MSNKMKFITVTMAVTTAAGLGLLLRKNKAKRQPQAISSVGAATSPDRVADLEGQVGRLERQIGRLAASSLNSTRSVGELPAVPTRAVPTSRQMEPEQQRAFLDGILAKEERDHAWAPRFEADLASSLRQRFPKDSITHLSCKTSICRIEVAHSQHESREAFHKGFGYTLPPATHALVHIRKGAGEQWVTEIHVIRPGQNPPTMAAR